jgi:hypothetical protein
MQLAYMLMSVIIPKGDGTFLGFYKNLTIFNLGLPDFRLLNVEYVLAWGVLISKIIRST